MGRRMSCFNASVKCRLQALTVTAFYEALLSIVQYLSS